MQANPPIAKSEDEKSIGQTVGKKYPSSSLRIYELTNTSAIILAGSSPSVIAPRSNIV